MATPDQLIEYVNIQGTDYAGLPEEDLLGLKWLSVVHSDDVNRVQLAWETAARTQTSVGIECRFRRFDGQYRWHDVRSRPLLDDNGMIQKWIGTATDIEDAKRAEADLHRSKHEAEEALVLLETFQSNVPIGFCLVDTDFRILRINETLAALNGLPVAEQIGRRVADVQPKLWPQIEQHYQRVLKTGKPVLSIETESTATREPTQVRNWLESYYPVILHDEIIGVGAVVVDITLRKRAEDLLRQSEESYKLMFESAPLAINVTRGTNITYANPTYLKMFGFSSLDQLRGVSSMDLFAPQWRAQIRENIQRRAAGLPVLDSYEAECLRKDGTTFPVLMQFTRAEFADGPATVGFITDITDYKRAVEVLREGDLQFRTFVEQAPIAVGVTRDGTLLYANAKLVEMVGLESVDEVVGAPIHRFFAPAEQEDQKERTRRRSLGLPVSSEHESVFQRVDGSQFPVHIAIGPVRLRDGSANIGFIADITERRRAEDALRQAEQVASERSHFLEELLEAIPAPVHNTDVTFHYVACNEAY
ncbi:MAG: PAS domain S-box protein, partial [Acidimicrobiales bacterium]